MNCRLSRLHHQDSWINHALKQSEALLQGYHCFSKPLVPRTAVKALHQLATRLWLLRQGMIHISELSWDVVMTPESVVQQGTPVRCAVLDVNVPKARISLSLKRMQVHESSEVLSVLRQRQIMKAFTRCATCAFGGRASCAGGDTVASTNMSGCEHGCVGTLPSLPGVSHVKLSRITIAYNANTCPRTS